MIKGGGRRKIQDRLTEDCASTRFLQSTNKDSIKLSP